MKNNEEVDKYEDKYDFIPADLLPLVVDSWTNSKLQEYSRLNNVCLSST